MNVAAVVPSLKPDDLFKTVVDELVDAGFDYIIVVDDGSGPSYRSFFDYAAGQGCVVLRHEENRGKGRALKTAIEHFLEDTRGKAGVVTLDADGQHSTQDVCRCAEVMDENPGCLIVGARDFDHDIVPIKSEWGNKITRNIIRWLYGLDMTDTQTGLRGIPAGYCNVLLNVRGERYEFETNMLLQTKMSGVKVVEYPIHTIYLNNNSGSHFSLRDVLLIYGLIVVKFLKFAGASVASFFVDILLFALLNYLLRNMPASTRLLVATVGARVCSALFNFAVNKTLVFKNNAGMAPTLLKYAFLCVAQMLVSYGGVYLLSGVLGMPAVPAKLIVDTVLFFISFFIQHKWVFADR